MKDNLYPIELSVPINPLNLCVWLTRLESNPKELTWVVDDTSNWQGAKIYVEKVYIVIDL